jgi:hypothetical protein
VRKTIVSTQICPLSTQISSLALLAWVLSCARVLSCKHLVLPTTGIEKKRLFDIHLLFLIISLLFVLKCWFFFENISAGSD